jgi:NDP-sugar pyrophosphorylase family protein
VIDTALILAAGLGTRLAPLSWIRAKAALPVAGEVLIRRQIRWLAKAGVTRVVVNLHHLPATITARLGRGDDLGVAVRYSWEAAVLGSAGGPRRALELLDRERFFVVNGDTLTDLDLAALAQAHVAAGALVTMAAVAARPGYNAVRVAAGQFAGVVPAAEVTAAGDAVHFIGVQVADRRAFAGVRPNVAADTVRGLYPELVAGRPEAVAVYRCAAAFHDVGTPLEYLRTARTTAAAEGRPLDCGPGTQIDPSATVEGTVCWDDVHVGARAVVAGCVIADGARVPPGVEVHAASIVPRHGRTPGPHHRVIGDVLVAPFASRPGACE